ncbi:Uncharacterised protein [Mycobacteroides abscessus subsp. abscessus]|nr:Uncharacterised protein [Mycobacteroides abscessus subsp. abscessus]
MPAQDHLCRTHVVCLGDGADRRILQNRALAEWRPRLGGNAVFGVERAQFGLGEPRVQLDLVEGGYFSGLIDKPLEVVDGEVADADGLGAPIGLDPL